MKNERRKNGTELLCCLYSVSEKNNYGLASNDDDHNYEGKVESIGKLMSSRGRNFLKHNKLKKGNIINCVSTLKPPMLSVKH